MLFSPYTLSRHVDITLLRFRYYDAVCHAFSLLFFMPAATPRCYAMRCFITDAIIDAAAYAAYVVFHIFAACCYIMHACCFRCFIITFFDAAADTFRRCYADLMSLLLCHTLYAGDFAFIIDFHCRVILIRHCSHYADTLACCFRFSPSFALIYAAMLDFSLLYAYLCRR